MNYTVSFLNLGCKVNAYETEALAEQLKNAGFRLVEFGNPSDITIINTCTVTGMADKKSRQMIHRASRISPDGIIVAMGCYVQVMTDEQREQEKDIDLFIGNEEKAELVRILEDYLSDTEEEDCPTDAKYGTTASASDPKVAEYGTTAPASDSKAAEYGTTAPASAPKAVKRKSAVFVSDINDGKCEYENLVLTGTTKHTRAYIKIEDGCNQFCSYCLIPYARGRVRSKAPQIVEDEIRGLLSKGYKEIVLTGIHLGSYGRDKEELSLSDVIDRISTLQDEYADFRLRLGSLEPMTITERFLESLKRVRGFCPHFHLSLQSGCETTLKAMNRKYTPDEYREKCELIRKYWPVASITTDVIVGFPGETDEDFRQSMEFVRNINFAKTHIFKYSKREGTRAAKRTDQIAENVKQERSHKLIALDEARRNEYIDHFRGSVQEVLVEETKNVDGVFYDTGHTREYLQVMIPVAKENAGIRNNTFVDVMLSDEVVLS